MHYGLYDRVIDRFLHRTLTGPDKDRYRADTARLDVAESPGLLALYVGRVLGAALERETGEGALSRRIDIVNDLLVELARRAGDSEILEAQVHEEGRLLLALLDGQSALHTVTARAPTLVRPETPIGRSSILTAARHEPSLMSELKRELVSANRVDMLVSFIKWSGLRLLMDELRALAEGGRSIRVITTTYIGATDVRAVDELAAMPNTQVRVSYDTTRTRLHAKAYVIHRDTGYSTAYVGSSNLSVHALADGLEWNVKLSAQDLPEAFAKLVGTFEGYWNDEAFVPYSAEDRPTLIHALGAARGQDAEPFFAPFDIRPYGFQEEILDRLRAEREIGGHTRNLVVAATGTGKTVMAAFDYQRFAAAHRVLPRLLFVAHREEILRQSLATFRAVLKDPNFGDLFAAGSEPLKLDHLFVSIQTLNSRDLPRHTGPDHYAYIVVDEFHHAAAPSYRRLLETYKPEILLGLTATPERLDGLDVTQWFDQRVAAELRLPEAIDRGLLAPFHYFGVSDTVDLSTLRWTRQGYDPKELSALYTGNRQRARLVIRSILKYVTSIDDVVGLGFCASVAHAEFMADMLNQAGIPSRALHAGSPTEERTHAKRDLVHGDLRFLFVVDLYNEGVDIPEVNTVLFLRPTESLTVFLQQLGRGLRLSEGKDCLTVLDFIGQSHTRYSFSEKLRALMDGHRHGMRQEVQQGFGNVPRGSFVQLERQAQAYVLDNIRQSLDSLSGLVERIRTFHEDTGLETTLENVAEVDRQTMREFYRQRVLSFAELRVRAGLDAPWSEPDSKTITRALARVAAIDSRRWIKYLLSWLQGRDMGEPQGELERRMLRMFHYTVWQQPLESSASWASSLDRIRRNPRLAREVGEILAFNLDHLGFVDEPVDVGFASPLDLHCSYARDQILAGLDVFTDHKKSSMREGVVHVPDKRLDAFFITLNKSEKDYSPTTMYLDHAISETLFHWQSQSTTSADSATGRRYVHHRETGDRVLLFVRTHKSDAFGTLPYMFLGRANYVGHQGSRPMSITWRLDRPMPPALLREASVVAV